MEKGGGAKGSGGRGMRGSGGKRERREGQVRVEGPLLWILDTPLLSHDHSDIMLLLQSLKTVIMKPALIKL